MEPNPVMRKLGLRDDDRAVILHVDDLGMCQASVDAYHDLVDFGLISSAATMVPCPWFPSVASFVRDHLQVDVGVHSRSPASGTATAGDRSPRATRPVAFWMRRATFTMQAMLPNNTAELRAITADWPSRVANYQVFTSEALRRFLQGSGLHVIGYRHLQALLPGA